MAHLTVQFTLFVMYLEAFLISFNCGFLFWMHINSSNNKLETYNLSTIDERAMTKLMHNAAELNSTIIDQLYLDYQNRRTEMIAKNVRILCWVQTWKNNHHTQAIHVKYTWGRRCDKLLFISEALDDILPTIAVDAEAGRVGLTKKVFRAFQYIYKNYFDEYDWFLKADDDSYVVMENVRKLLASYDPEQPEYVGLQLNNPTHKDIAPDGFMLGGTYVLSRESLRRLATRAFVGNSLNCPLVYLDHESEDIVLAQCLRYLGGKLADTRDTEGRLTIFHYDIDTYVNGTIPQDYLFWGKNFFWGQLIWANSKGAQRSKIPITLHHMPPQKYYVMESLLYNTKVLGVTNVAKVYRNRTAKIYPVTWWKKHSKTS